MELAEGAGFNPKNIYTKNGVPGYYRISKKWDLVVVDDEGSIVAALEYKSVGSRADNVNNRIEEAIGSAIDINAAMSEGLLSSSTNSYLWTGYLVMMNLTEDAEKERNTTPIIPQFTYRDVFGKRLSYMERMKIFLLAAVEKGLYTKSSLVLARDPNRLKGDIAYIPYSSPETELLPEHFFMSYQTHLENISTR